MTHFGIFCPAAIGHLNPMCNLGRELLRRGHKVTLFGVPDVQSKIAQSGLEFYEVGGTKFPIGTVENAYAQLGKLSGLAGLKFSIQFFQEEAEMWFKDAPDAIQTAQVDVLIVDQVTTAVGTVADLLQLPFITVCNALLINREPDVPPYFTHWDYQHNPWQRLRNQAGNALIAYLTRPIWDTIQQQRQQWQLPPFRYREDSYSQLAQICQLPAVLDFPRKRLAKCFHYIGPLQDPSGTEPVTFKHLEFPFEQLNHSKVIYASLGTLQNRNWEIFHKIAAACLELNAQLVISLGNPTQDIAAANFPGSPLVVAYAPHQQLIRRSTLVITHAGLNTVIGTLSDGVPIVAIPITNEQPGIAARVARTGSGKVVPLTQLTVPTLRSVITEVLTNPSYRENAARIQTAIKEAGGVKVAADIIEQALTVAK